MQTLKPIVLMTDFGEEDGYVGIMKGVINGITPGAAMIDLSHGIPPQDVLAGAMTLARAVAYFPPETIFVCVVDPGVGTERRSLAARIGSQYYVGPDNGLLTLWLEEAEKKRLPLHFVHLNQPRYWRPELSHSFHGRDLYAPVAAYLAGGVLLEDMGSPVNDPICLDIPQPNPINRGWSGVILHIDHFGNLATNIAQKHLTAFAEDISQGIPKAMVRYGEYSVPGISISYGQGKAGSLVSIIDSAGYLSLALVNGSARDYLGAEIGDMVRVIFDLDEE